MSPWLCLALCNHETPILKPEESTKLTTHIYQHKKRWEVRALRKPHSFARIPISLFEELATFGRGKYRAIVVAAWLGSLWDGWRKQGGKQEVMLTRRMMANNFSYNPVTVKSALDDLLQAGHISVAKEAVSQVKQGRILAGNTACAG